MPGSDQRINYQLRPAKSIERKMLCELIREILIVEERHDFRYIGMGAKYFSDFLLFHNEFGISDMISIESDYQRRARYDFNKPLRDIVLRYGESSSVLSQITGYNEKMNVVWLDYDSRFSTYMLDDLDILSKNLCCGSVFLISCNCTYEGKNPTEKREQFWKGMEDLIDDDIPNEYFTSKRIPVLIRKLCEERIQNAIEQRNRMEIENRFSFEQLTFFSYCDGAKMMTLGWIITDELLCDKLETLRNNDKLQYITDTDKYFNIDIPKLTIKEMQFILAHLPKDEEEYKRKVFEESDFYHGIEYREIDQFKRIYRFYPFYSESRMNN